MQTKICKGSCGLLLPLEAFSKDKYSKDGRQRICKECHKKSVKKHYLENKNMYVKNHLAYKNIRLKAIYYKLCEYLNKHPCIKCGENDVRILEFHHRDVTTKIGSVMKLATAYSDWIVVEKEMEKCDVVCGNCHSIIHFEKDKGLKHYVVKTSIIV